MSTPQKLATTALKASTADECIVIANASSTANLRWANNTLTTNGVTTGTSVTVVSIVDGTHGKATGVVSRGVTSLDQVKALVADADDAARAATPADDAAPLVEGAESDDWWADPELTHIDVFADLAARLGDTFGRAKDAGELLYGFASHDVDTTYLASSTGLRRRFVQPSGHVSMTGKPTDFSTSAWVGQATEDFADVDVAALDAELVRRIGWAANRVELPAGRYETILPPTAVADLAVYAYWTAQGRPSTDGETVFSAREGGTKVGQRIAKPEVTMRSDPAFAGVATAPFHVATRADGDISVFDNGADLAPTDWISDGVLRHLMTSRHSAGETGLDFTPGIGNLIVDVAGGVGSADDLVATTERGLLLTCLWYIREVDPQTLLLTGLTRDGVYLVEDGRVTGAVNNFRFNESPISLLDRFTGAGAAVRSFSREWGDFFPRTVTPALRIPDFNMSSVSQAS